MREAITEAGKPCFKDVRLTDSITREHFHEVDMSWNSEGDKQWALHTNLGTLTVLDRMTGFGYRDTETGYRYPYGFFWLASGDFDIRDHISRTRSIGKAIQLVKENANNSFGYSSGEYVVKRWMKTFAVIWSLITLTNPELLDPKEAL